MSDLDNLRTLSRQIWPPAFEDLVAVARKRRRRAVLAAAAAVAVLVLGVGVAGAAMSGDPGAHGPAQDPPPTPTGSPSPAGRWTPERIRELGGRGDPQGEIATTESGLSTRMYQACDGSRCETTDGPPVDLHVALEVIQDGLSAVFDLHYSPQPWVRAFDEDSVLVQDAEGIGGKDPVRYRLLRADGTALELQLVEDPAPAVPGPGVVIIESFSGWNAGLDGTDDLYVVDERAGTLQPLDAPDDEVRYWGPNVEEFLWGVTDDCRAFWAIDGAFEERRLDCSRGLDFTRLDDDLPPGWLRPGRMVVAEQFDNGDRTALHVSLDRGATWRRVPVDSDSGGAIADVLREFG